MKIIAESGVNYNNIDGAIKYCSEAKRIGADIIKFQITDVKKTWVKNSMEYVQCLKNSFGNVEDIYWQLKNMELTENEWESIKLYCDSIGIEFLATPATIEKLDFLMSIGMKRIKISSDRAIERELINHALTYKVPVIVSNGMFNVNYKSDYIEKMYCISKYPAKLEDYKIEDMKEFSGLSDHTLKYGHDIVKILYEKKFKYYEKHFKVDNYCIDAKSSITVNQFESLIKNIRNLEII